MNAIPKETPIHIVPGSSNENVWPPAEWLYIEEVCNMLGLGKSAIHTRINKGIFRPIPGRKPGEKGGDRLMFNPAEIQEELIRVDENRRVKPGQFRGAIKTESQQLNMKNRKSKESKKDVLLKRDVKILIKKDLELLWMEQ